VEGQHRLKIGATNQLTYGVNYRYNTTTSNFLSGSKHENRLGLYVQEEWKPISMFTAVAGLRFDMDTYINPTYSPRAALIFKPAENHSLRFTFAIAYRTPTIFETHTDARAAITVPGFPPFIGSAFGSENLKPEKITSYELAYQGWYFKHRLRTRVALFLNNLKDLIAQVPTGVGTDVVFANTSGEATIQGVEGGTEFLVTPWLTGFANVSYQDISQSLLGVARRGGPQWKANGGLRADFKEGLFDGINGEAVFHFVGSADYPIGDGFTLFSTFPGGFPAPNERVGSYTLLNLRGGYRFWNDKAELAVSVSNALNDRHKEHPLGETIKSRALGWLTIRLP
jgi:iron complex outermembrane receptor protein